MSVRNAALLHCCLEIVNVDDEITKTQSNMQLIINGEKIDFSAGKTVRQLLEQLQIADRPVAVERNGTIVSYSVFDRTELTEGDSLEVVTLVGGG